MIHLCILYLDWRKQFIKLKKNNPKKSYSMSASRQTPKKNNNDKSENFSLYLSIPQLIS